MDTARLQIACVLSIVAGLLIVFAPSMFGITPTGESKFIGATFASAGFIVFVISLCVKPYERKRKCNRDPEAQLQTSWRDLREKCARIVQLCSCDAKLPEPEIVFTAGGESPEPERPFTFRTDERIWAVIPAYEARPNADGTRQSLECFLYAFWNDKRWEATMFCTPRIDERLGSQLSEFDRTLAGK